METFKFGTYSDVPDGLEKGCPPAAQPLHPEACHACSAQPARTRRRRSFVKRHWIAFGTVALIWLVFSYGQRAFDRPHHVWVCSHRCLFAQRHSSYLSQQWEDDNVKYPPTADGDVDQCVSSTNWTTRYDQPPWALEYPYGAETAFSLPLHSDALYLISRGAFQHGLVNIEQSTQVADTVDIRVRVAYHDDDALERATVCQMERADREHGVGIFVRYHRLILSCCY